MHFNRPTDDDRKTQAPMGKEAQTIYDCRFQGIYETEVLRKTLLTQKWIDKVSVLITRLEKFLRMVISLLRQVDCMYYHWIFLIEYSGSIMRNLEYIDMNAFV